MDGDNNLGSSAIEDIDEMKAIGSTDNVQVIVQLDLPQGITTKRYRIVKNDWELISDLGELDMANPQTLTDFLVWAKDAYPADRVVLVLWNHGNGWDQGDGPSQPAAGISRKSIFYDEDNKSPFLANHQVKKAIQASGIKLDVLGLDASIMGTIEALYEFKDLAPIIISSQEVGESHGWYYTPILSQLTGNPRMNTEDLSRIIVDSYHDFLESYFYPAFPTYEKRHTIAALRTACLGTLATEVDSLAAGLRSQLSDPATSAQTVASIGAARSNAQEIDHYIQPGVYVDLQDFDRLFTGGSSISSTIAEGTIKEYHGDARPNAHGVSIVFFRSRTINTYDKNYRNYDAQTGFGNGGDFINHYHWDEFLDTYYSAAGL
ncbi:MAG: clostripain-related cysteine peptidase [Nitrospiraceae bacterium]|nr:clostripain-related cysteine peptidase [Nitrospiraceae bacterium]